MVVRCNNLIELKDTQVVVPIEEYNALKALQERFEDHVEDMKEIMEKQIDDQLETLFRDPNKEMVIYYIEEGNASNMKGWYVRMVEKGREWNNPTKPVTEEEKSYIIKNVKDNTKPYSWWNIFSLFNKEAK